MLSKLVVTLNLPVDSGVVLLPSGQGTGGNSSGSLLVDMKRSLFEKCILQQRKVN